MEILTLLKANIRHKKGSFVSIIILMIIISMSFTAILSVKDNCINSIENALDSVNAGDLSAYISSHRLTDDLLESVENHSSVKEAVATFGAEFSDQSDANSWFMLKLTDEYKLLNDDLTDYAEETPALSKGEMYITQGLNTKLGCTIGDKIQVATLGGEREFTIKGFVVEPVCGCMNMGWKQVFVSDEDFAELQQDAIDNETDESKADYRILQIYKADSSVTESEFKRQLNLDTGIIDNSFGALLKSSQSVYYTNMFPDIILSVLIVFVIFLVIIVLIVMAHSVSTSIEMEYVNLGVLKSQGFSQSKIRTIFVLQYLVAEFTGAIIGVVLAVPLIKIFGNIFQPILAIPAENNVSLLTSILFTVGVLVVSSLFVFVITHKIGRISPVKAISGGKNDIYFTSRLNAPISPKTLSASLALRQFTSNKRRYVGTMIIIGILMFFMITMNVLGNSIDSKSAMESMGQPYIDCELTFKESVSDSTIKEIENTIEQYSEIDKKYHFTNMYMSLNGDEYMCAVYKNPEAILITEGRVPKYDNEIAITDILADELGLKIGDEVTVSNNNNKSEYIITGINVFMNDLGLNFSMPLAGAERLGVEDVYYCSYSLKDSTKAEDVANAINNNFSDVVSAEAVDSDVSMEMYTLVVDAMTVIIYVVSVIFSLVVVMMVCNKTFLQERRDIGIYKALGFTSKKLRLQFAVRFLIVSVIGSVLGSILSLCFTEKVLTVIFREIGIASFNAQFTFVAFIVPVVLICVCFFIFAYFASRKIKKVEIKELVIE